MSLFRKIRPKDWRRIAFAVVSIAGVTIGLTLVFANLFVSAIGGVAFSVILLAQRPYLYLRYLVFPRWNKLPRNNWSNYYFED